VVAILLSGCAPAYAGHQHLEAWYQAALAQETGATREVRMHDGTRCDVLTDTHAAEVEFAPKWCEAVGQSLNYASQTGRAGGIAIILESQEDERFLQRLRALIEFHRLPLAVVVMRPFGKDGLEFQNLSAIARPTRAWLQSAPLATPKIGGTAETQRRRDFYTHINTRGLAGGPTQSVDARKPAAGRNRRGILQ
jgi:hypothetical protein